MALSGLGLRAESLLTRPEDGVDLCRAEAMLGILPLLGYVLEALLGDSFRVKSQGGFFHGRKHT